MFTCVDCIKNFQSRGGLTVLVFEDRTHTPLRAFKDIEAFIGASDQN